MHIAVAIVASVTRCLRHFRWTEVELVIRWRFENCGVEWPECTRFWGDTAIELRDVSAEATARYGLTGTIGFKN